MGFKLGILIYLNIFYMILLFSKVSIPSILILPPLKLFSYRTFTVCSTRTILELIINSNTQFEQPFGNLFQFEHCENSSALFELTAFSSANSSP